MVPLWFAPDRDRLRQRGRAQAEREGPVGGAAARRAAGPRPGCPTACSTWCTATRWRSTRCSTHPDVARGVVRRLAPRSPATCTRPAPAHGKRVQALGGAKNHMVVLPDADLDARRRRRGHRPASARRGSGAWPISVVVAVDPVGDDLVARIAERMAGLRTGDGRARLRHGPAGHRRAPGQGRRLRRRRRRRRARRWSSTGAAVAVRRQRRDGFWLGPTLFDHVPPEACRSTPTRSSGRCLAWSARRPSTRRLTLVNASPYGNGTAIFTNDGGARPALPERGRGRHGRHQRPHPGAAAAYYSFGGWKSSLFGDTHAYGPDGVHFFTRAKVVTSKWPRTTVPHAQLDLNFPGNR